MIDRHLSSAQKDLMSEFLYVAVNRVLKKKFWNHEVIPQGVSVFNVHSDGRIEYLFTKDECLDMKRDDVEDLRAMVRDYTDLEIGIVFVMNSSCVDVVSKHRKYSY